MEDEKWNHRVEIQGIDILEWESLFVVWIAVAEDEVEQEDWTRPGHDWGIRYSTIEMTRCINLKALLSISVCTSGPYIDPVIWKEDYLEVPLKGIWIPKDKMREEKLKKREGKGKRPLKGLWRAIKEAISFQCHFGNQIRITEIVKRRIFWQRRMRRTVSQLLSNRQFNCKGFFRGGRGGEWGLLRMWLKNE